MKQWMRRLLQGHPERHSMRWKTLGSILSRLLNSLVANAPLRVGIVPRKSLLLGQKLRRVRPVEPEAFSAQARDRSLLRLRAQLLKERLECCSNLTHTTDTHSFLASCIGSLCHPPGSNLEH